MTSFLLLAAVLIVLSIAVALVRILFVGGDTDRLMATQLLSTGGIAAMLLFGVVNQQSAVVDVALILAVLTAFAGVAFVHAYQQRRLRDADQDHSA